MRFGKYKCPTCGYEEARWHIWITTSPQALCEQCLPDFTTPNSHIEGYFLERSGYKCFGSLVDYARL